MLTVALSKFVHYMPYFVCRRIPNFIQDVPLHRPFLPTLYQLQATHQAQQI